MMRDTLDGTTASGEFDILQTEFGFPEALYQETLTQLGPPPPSDPAAFLQAAMAIVPLQLLAYRIARLRGLNVDQPRNRAKTVTVE